MNLTLSDLSTKLFAATDRNDKFQIFFLSSHYRPIFDALKSYKLLSVKIMNYDQLNFSKTYIL